MTAAQQTLDGVEFALAQNQATWPDGADEQTPFGGIYEQEGGDKTFALHRCPACGVALNPHRWPAERTAEPVAHHILENHDSLEDFDEVDLHDDQRKLPLAGEVMRR